VTRLLRLCVALYIILVATIGILPSTRASSEDGYDLWLRYRPVDASYAASYRAMITELIAPDHPTPPLAAARR
jgi:alpha-glucuronidase